MSYDYRPDQSQLYVWWPLAIAVLLFVLLADMALLQALSS